MAPSPAKLTENGSTTFKSKDDSNPPTIAAFAPSSSYASPTSKQRSSILVHRKSALLVATPPSITRALAFSHPFLLPLNKLVGLLSWTSGDPWESFLLVAGFWASVLYGDVIIRWGGPVMVVVALILGMYSRRYSPLSSAGWTGEQRKGHKKELSESSMKHQKSLDEIVDTLVVLTSRCNVLLEPFLQMTDFLSTQRTATSASTKPALTTLFIRILFITPIWIILTLPPLQIITTKRVVIAVGTLILSWHSRPARVSRLVLWRSRAIRHISSIVTGLSFSRVEQSKDAPPPLPPRNKSQHAVANSLATRGRSGSSGVRFTFVVFENQRRWLGLGWTSSLLAYERRAWTDEHLHPSDSKENFQLPEVQNEVAHWRWVPGNEWQVEGAGKSKTGNKDEGWIYYDNKWNDGRRGADGWGRYTRRRKWFRDAELVEKAPDTSSETLVTSSSSTTATNQGPPPPPSSSSDPPPEYSQVVKESDDASSSQARKGGLFTGRKRTSGQNSSSSRSHLEGSEDEGDQGVHHPYRYERGGDWGVGDEVKMGLG